MRVRAGVDRDGTFPQRTGGDRRWCNARGGPGHCAHAGRCRRHRLLHGAVEQRHIRRRRAGPETIEETAELVTHEGGSGIAVRVDHTMESEVVSLMARIKSEQGRLDILVNDIWGGDALIDWSHKFWQVDIGVLRTLMERAVFSHLITARHAAPLMIEKDRGLIVEVTDGHTDGYRGQIIYDLVKSSDIRLGYAMAWDLAETGITALSLSPGFLRSEAVLATLGVTEANWQDGIAKSWEFAESETPCLVGRAVVALASDPNLRAKAGRTYFASDLAREYGFTDVDGRVPDFWGNFDRGIEKILAHDGPLEDQDRFYVWARYCQIHRDPAHRAYAAETRRAAWTSGRRRWPAAGTAMSAKAAIGFRAHMGWVAAVGITLEDGAPRVVHSSIIATAEDRDQIAKEPYHVAGGYDGLTRVARPPDPEAIIAKGRKTQEKLAARAIADIAAEFKARKLKIACGAVLSTRAWLGHDLEGILGDHAHIHVYEGEAVRDAVRSALKASKIACRDVDQKSLYTDSSKALTLSEPKLKAVLTGLGAGVKPWTQDQKLSALAAWLTLVS